MHIVVAAAGTNNWDVGMTNNTFTWQNGKKYTFSCFFKVKKGTLQFRMKPEHATGAYEGYGDNVFTGTEKWTEYHVTTPVFTADVNPGSPTFHFAFAPGDFWIDDVKVYVGDYVPTVVKSHPVATSPTPADKATDVARDVTLGWKAGPYAATHNVYLGTTFADVNTADATKAVSKGQTGTTYKVATPLEYGQTYYWRVDEVNAAPSTTVFKGDVWSFTVEPYAYPITNITATASSSQAGMGPAEHGQRLRPDGGPARHRCDTMWLSSPAHAQLDPVPVRQGLQARRAVGLELQPADRELHRLRRQGCHDRVLDGRHDLDAAGRCAQFARAPAAAGYAANTTVDLAGVMAQYVKLTINSTWGSMGLSRSERSAVLLRPGPGRAPQPATDATGVSLTAALDWRPGRDVTSQKVYFGTDKAAVTNGTATAQTVTDHGYTPPR